MLILLVQYNYFLNACWKTNWAPNAKLTKNCSNGWRVFQFGKWKSNSYTNQSLTYGGQLQESGVTLY